MENVAAVCCGGGVDGSEACVMRLSKLVYVLGSVFGVFFLSASIRAETIRVGDTVQITLKAVPASERVKVDGCYKVGDGGNIQMPLINVKIRVAGRKPKDVERSIEAAFKKAKIYRAPNVSLQIVQGGCVYTDRVLSVGGYVRKPGRVRFREGMTLLEAIQKAGDRTTFASKYVYLIRKDKKTGKQIKYKFNIGEPKHQALKVYPNDTIDVLQRWTLE